MATLHSFEAGGYALLEGGFPYSQGVHALPGFELRRARFAHPMSVAAGFDAIAAHLNALGRPLTALAACELRSPSQMSFEGFRSFNVGYVQVLERWGLVANGLNPVARSNVCPEFDAPAEPAFHAFCYTVEAPAGAPPTWVVAGSGEWPEGTAFPDNIVARGDLSESGLDRKIGFVVETMQARAAGLGGNWSDLTASNVYTVHDFHPSLRRRFAEAGLTAAGLTWQVCRPPIAELEFEMDVRCVTTETVLR